MVFQYAMHFCLGADQNTGRIDTRGTVIPDKYCKYLEGSGSHFRHYFGIETTSPESVLQCYPEWDTVGKHNEWSEEDHVLLKDFLQFLEHEINPETRIHVWP